MSAQATASRSNQGNKGGNVTGPKMTPEQREAAKVERFKKVATGRLNNVLKTMDLLANCGNTGNYSYTEEQVQTILSHLADKYRKVEAAFQETAKGAERETIQL